MTNPASATETTRPSGRLLSPPLRVWMTLASLGAATALVRFGWLELIAGDIVDQAVRNIISLILAFSGVMSLLVWFLRESGHAAWLKRAVGYGLVGLVLLAAGLFRIERVSGDLVPELRLRWLPSQDRLLPAVQTDGEVPTTFRVDDVSIRACGPQLTPHDATE